MQAVKVIQVKGNHFAAGYMIGRKTAKDIQRILRKQKKDEHTLPSGARSSRILLNRFKKRCKCTFPNYYKELEGMAEGANVPFDQIFYRNIREIALLNKQRNKLGGCTTIVFPHKNGFLVGHNEDAYKDNTIFVLKAKIGSDPAFLAVNYFGMLPGFSVSINQNGIFQLSNYLESDKIVEGNPCSFLLRATLAAKNINSAHKMLLERSSSEAYMYMQKKQAVFIEAHPRKIEIKKIKQSFVHTNHFTFSSMRKCQVPINTKETATLFRRKRALQISKSAGSIPLLKRMLSDHQQYPESICQHGFNDFHTIASVLFDSSKKELLICKGNPCNDSYSKYSLDQDFI